MNILESANEIVNNRSEEKGRLYGPFDESMERMADLFNSMTGLELNAIHMYKAMIALKLSREAYRHKEDNILDAAAYIGAMNNHIELYKSKGLDEHGKKIIKAPKASNNGFAKEHV